MEFERPYDAFEQRPEEHPSIVEDDQDEPLGRLVYLVNLDPSVSTSKLSDEILSADRDNIDSVEWEQKESKTYLYK